MRKNMPITNKERTFQAQQRLISATDTAGHITYCNNDFVDISGFTREELIGQQHNIVRHPDVPPQIYQHMWSCLKKGEPWMGIVKNRCKNGDFYWVNAYVSPVFEHEKLVGYESVRTVPTADEVKRATRVYQSFWKRKSAGLAPEWVHKAIDVAVISVPAFIGAVLHGIWDGPVGIAATILFTLLAGLAGSLWHYHKMEPAMKRARRSISHPVIAAMYTDSRGIHSRIEMALISLEARIRTAMNRVHDGTANLQQQSDESDHVAASNRALANEQYEEAQQLSAATHQLTQATHEIAQNIQRAAEATEEADSLSHHGKALSSKAQQEMEALGSAMVQAKATVTKFRGNWHSARYDQ